MKHEIFNFFRSNQFLLQTIKTGRNDEGEVNNWLAKKAKYEKEKYPNSGKIDV